MKLIQSAMTPASIDFRSMVAGRCYREVGTSNVVIAAKAGTWLSCYPLDVVTGRLAFSDDLEDKLFVEVEAEVHVK